ncbi:MAG: hypothetical protein ACHP7E_01990 [Burkholderiales bacterium]
MFKPLCAALAALVLVSCGGGGGGDPAAASGGSSDMAAASGGKSVVVPLSPSSAPAQAGKHAVDPVVTAQPVSLVNTITPGDQTLRTVGATSDGGYVAVWISTDFWYMQAYDEAGAKVGSQVHIQAEIAAPTEAANRLAIEQSSFAVLTDGSVVVLYTITRDVPVPGGYTDSVTGVFFQVVGKDGFSRVPETQVASQSFAGPKGPYLGIASVEALSGGGFVVASELRHYTNVFSSISGLSLYWFDAQGKPVGSPVDAGGFPELRYGMVADAHGGLTLSTIHTSNVYQRLYTEYHYDTAHTASTIVAPSERPVELLPLEEGYVLFTAGSNVTMQMLDSQGNPVGAPATVASLPWATGELADGTYVVIWRTNGAFTAQQFAADGTSLGAPMPIDTQGGAPVMAALADPGFVAAWTAPGASGDADVYAQRFMEPLRHARKVCRDSAKAQGLKGKQRKAFVDECVAVSA